MTIHRPAIARKQLMRLFVGSALLAMGADQAAAEDTKLTQQPFQISLGSFTNSSEITIRADGENQEGTEFRRYDLQARQLLAHQRSASRALHVHGKLEQANEDS